MTNADTKFDEGMSVVDPEVFRFVEKIGLFDKPSMLYGKCSALVRWRAGQQLPVKEIVQFARATSFDQQDSAIADRGFRVIDVRNDFTIQVGQIKGLAERSAFYDFSVGNRGRGGAIIVF